MSKKLRTGDEVSWNTPQGPTRGTVEKTLTGKSRIKGHDVAASAKEPQYLVRSAKTGKVAAHRRGALKKRG